MASILLDNELPPSPVHRFSVAQYHRMIDSGVLAEDDRVELLEGWILPKMPHTPRHDSTVHVVSEVVSNLLPKTHVVRNQAAMTLNDSEPEPDLAVVLGPSGRYSEEHPGPRDTALVVEVSASSLRQDRGLKQRIYARSRIPIYWIVNLIDGQVEVYTSPRAGKSPGYRERRDYRGDQAIPLVIDGREVGTVIAEELLP